MMHYLQQSGATYGEKALLLVQQVHQLQERLRLRKEACNSPGSKAVGVNASACSLAAAQQQALGDAATHLDCSQVTNKTTGVYSAAMSNISHTAGAAATACMSPATTVARAASGRVIQRQSSAGFECQHDGLQHQSRGHDPDKQQQRTAILWQEPQSVCMSAARSTTITPQGCSQSSWTEAAAAAADTLAAAASKATHADVTRAKVAALHKAITILDLNMHQCKESLDALSDLLTSRDDSAAEQQTSILQKHLSTADMLLHRLRQMKICKQQVQLALSRIERPLNGGEVVVGVAALQASSSTQKPTAKAPCSGLAVPAVCTVPVAGPSSNGSAVNAGSRKHTFAPRQLSRSPTCADCRLPRHEEVSHSTRGNDKPLYDRFTSAQCAARASRHAATVRNPTCGAAGATAAAVTNKVGSDSPLPLLWQHQQATSERWLHLNNSKKLCSKIHGRHQDFKFPVSGQNPETGANRCNALKQSKPMHGTQARPRGYCECFPDNTVGTKACVQEKFHQSAAVPRKCGLSPAHGRMALQQALAKLQAVPVDGHSLSRQTDISPPMYVAAVTDARTHSSQSNSTLSGYQDHRLCSQSSYLAFRSQLLEMLMLTKDLLGCG